MAIVVLDRREVPWGTLDAILARAGLTYEEFLILAKVKSSE